MLGCRYDSGDQVGRNLAEAAKWFAKAAEQGHMLARFAFGKALVTGRGVKKNEKESIPYLLDAANDGNAEAQYHLGKLAGMDMLSKAHTGGKHPEQLAFELLKAAADQEYGQAQLELAVMHSLKNNHQISFGLYQKAALQGIAMAQRYLADCYLEGVGCKRDLELAELWYRRASEGNDKIAKKRLDNWKKYLSDYYPEGN